MPHERKDRNPGGGRREHDPAPRGRGTVNRGSKGAMAEPSTRERKLRHEIGRDPNDRQ